MPLHNTAPLKLREGERKMCSCGTLQTDSLTELITSNHRRNHGDGVIDGLCQAQDVGGAGGTRHCNLQTAGHWLDAHQISSIFHCGTSPFKVGHVIEYLIKAANWIDWLGCFPPSEHLPQCVGGIGGVGWHPVPRRGRRVLGTLLHRERPGGAAGAGRWAFQQCETMMLVSCFPHTFAWKHF